MKHIIIPLFRLITLPFLFLYLILIISGYIIYCLWEWDFTNFMKFEDFSLFNKTKPFYINYDCFNNYNYSYKTLFHYIFNIKTE